MTIGRRWFYQTVVFLTLAALVGCRSSVYVAEDGHKRRLPTRVNNTKDAKRVKKRVELNAKCVTVTSIGQDYLISISSSSLFTTQTPRLYPEAYPILDEVISYIKQYRKVAIYISSYSGHYVSAKREHALTLARARNIADYFESQDIDARLLFADGFGSTKPISACADNSDSAPNSRIEITFRNAII